MYKIKCDSWHKNSDAGLNFVRRLSFMTLCLLFTRAHPDFYEQSHPPWTAAPFHFFYDTNFFFPHFLLSLVKFTFYSQKNKPVAYIKPTSVELTTNIITLCDLQLILPNEYDTIYVYIEIMYFKKIGSNLKKKLSCHNIEITFQNYFYLIFKSTICRYFNFEKWY